MLLDRLSKLLVEQRPVSRTGRATRRVSLDHRQPR